MTIMTTLIGNHQKQYAELLEKYGPNFEKPSGYAFGLNVAEAKTVNAWLETIEPEILTLQGKQHGEIPNVGAIGGNLSYTFTPPASVPLSR